MKFYISNIKKLLIFAIISIILSLSSATVSYAAANPCFNSTSQYIKVSEKYNLKVNNKISGSKYTWTSSDKKVATVSSTGTVKGIRTGEAKITCSITAKSKTYKLACNILVINKDTTYTITEGSKPSASIQKKAAYNANTKDWYLFNELLTYCENAGGGKIVVKKGTYSICGKVSIPSNVTLVLEDGVVIKKLAKTGTSSFAATKTMFQLVAPSKASKEAVYSQYNGVHDVKIIGEGTATIDLDFMEGAVGFVMAHNQNISFENINFANMNSGHFIEMDASLNVTVLGCDFVGAKRSPKGNKEAINIDTPDKLTGGFSHVWSSFDKTPVKNLLVEDCRFEDVDVGIGTHKYSQIQDANGEYTITMFHEDVHVKNCKFLNLWNSSFKMIAWKNVTVEDCLFEGGGLIADSDGQMVEASFRGFSANAVVDLTLINNLFKNIYWIGGASSSTGTAPETASYVYTTIRSYITVENIKGFYTNRCSNVKTPNIQLQVDTFEASDENVGQRLVSRPDLFGEGVKYSLTAEIPCID